MPLILPGNYVKEWIKPETRPEELVEAAMTEMVYEKMPNRPRNKNTYEQMKML